ncbi:Leucine-specific-binding protein [Paraburkholderia hiiakae]|uniref:Leucine-specific-binding protein n=1 Tax=Paraburkholderia hiiakae TaxID=1081782 RepID=A0ABM8NEC6_9BURK|nr:branched-chain amino acid ABC transporter substrate-binding protein [Paraburkholderia hiiakae]CAD6519996.1 Leucine-specific-binding protein [Paraburkholderia hiiakae]
MKLNQLAVVTALCFAAASTSAFAQSTIRIGVVGPLTGSGASYGKDMENGVRIAIEEANAQKITLGGKVVQFAPEYMDDQGDPRTGVQVAQRLVDEGVSAVIGHVNSGTTIPASKIYASAGIPMITPAASNTMITKQGFNTVFSVVPTDAQTAGSAGTYAVTNLKARRIAIMDDQTAFGQGAAQEFRKAVLAAHGTIVDQQYTSDKSMDFSAQLTHIKSVNADLLFFSGLGPQIAGIAKKMKLLGMTTRLMGGGGTVSEDFIQIAGASAEGVEGLDYGLPVSRMPRGPEFENKYKKTFNSNMQVYAPLGYDATWVVIKAMQEANSSNPSDYLPKLRTLSYAGVSGPIEFDKTGALKAAATTIYQVRGGKWEVQETVVSR